MSVADQLDLDLLVVADPRLPFAEGRCLAALLATSARRGYRTGLLPVLGPRAGPGLAFHPAVSASLERREVACLDRDRPCTARLVLVHHLLPLLRPAGRRLPLRAEQLVVRVDQPWRAADGTMLAPLDAVLRHAEELFGAVPELVAADQLLASALAREGWADCGAWPPATCLAPTPDPHTPPAGSPLRVGRHLHGGHDAWPSVPGGLLAAYPADPSAELVLAEEAAIAAARLPSTGATWRLRPAELADPAAFLAGLDAYVLAVGPDWQPDLYPALAEAVAAGAPVVAPPSLRPLLGEAALYAEPADIPALLAGLRADRGEARHGSRAQAAEAFHAAETGPDALGRRLERRLGAPGPRPPRLRLGRDARAPRRALFLSPNGIGMGHLTRLLAVARRCDVAVEPVFLSMSQAVGVVEAMGYLAEYFPYHTHTGEPVVAWNAALRARLDEAIAFYDARLVVFDGNVPYQGLIDARGGHPNRAFAWIRRGMWRPEHGRATIDRARHFDLVVEPGEFAAALDQGPTSGRDLEAVRVPPVVLLGEDEILTREAARAELGLDPGRTAVLVQLGGRNNFDYAGIDEAVLEALGTRAEVELVVADWLIGETPSELPARIRRLRTFPVPRLLRAFDIAVSAAGYNSFHELLSLGVPTVFVPNENPVMDAQELRAVWAERNGLAFCVRRHDPYRAAWALRELLDPRRRAEFTERCRALPPCDGGARIARMVGELAGAVRLPDRVDRLPHALTRGR